MLNDFYVVPIEYKTFFYRIQLMMNFSLIRTIFSLKKTNQFQLVVKKTEPHTNLILNGRAALCAGRDDMSSDENESHEHDDESQKHVFNKPDQFKTLLESGAIPDAAMIHAARKKRQKARELGKLMKSTAIFSKLIQ